MESPEEWGPHLLQRGDGGGERIGDSSNMIVPLPSRMRRRARGRCSGGNIDGRSDHDWPTAYRPRHPSGGRPAGQPTVLRGGLSSFGLRHGVRARWSPGLRKRGEREAHPIRGRAARRRGPPRLLRSQPGGGRRVPRRGAGGGRDNGAPGPRPEYHAGYYGAYVFDPDGNNVEAVHHAVPSG